MTVLVIACTMLDPIHQAGLYGISPAQISQTYDRRDAINMIQPIRLMLAACAPIQLEAINPGSRPIAMSTSMRPSGRPVRPMAKQVRSSAERAGGKSERRTTRPGA